MTRILGIDPAGWTGLCHGEPGRKPVPSLFQAGASKIYGERFIALHDHLRRLIMANAVTHVFFEPPFLNHKKPDAKQISLLYGYQAHILSACSREKVKVYPVTSAEWRSHVLVDSPKSAPGHLSADARRKWWKAQAIAYCNKRGMPVEDDDVAEAICLWRYGCAHTTGDFHSGTPLFEQ